VIKGEKVLKPKYYWK